MPVLTGTRIVPDAKIARYLLDPTHPIGGAKARYFGTLGFSALKADQFVAALLLHADLYPVHAERHHALGVNRVVRGPLVTPDGRDPLVDVVWFQAAGDTTQRFVTAYPS